MKRTTLLLISILAAALYAAADIAPGSWRVIPSFGTPAQQVVVAGDNIYYAAGGSLFLYNAAEETNTALTRSTGLSGKTLTTITLFDDDKTIAAGYEDGAIDIIYPDGSITNLRDITEASIEECAINALAQSGDYLVAATDFGLVKFTLSDSRVESYGIYDEQLTSVAIVDGYIFTTNSASLYRTPLTTPLPHRFADLPKFADYTAGSELMAIGTTGLMLKAYDAVMLYDVTAGLTHIAKLEATEKTLTRDATDNGTVHIIADNKLYRADTGGITLTSSLPEETDGNICATADGTTLWALNTSGLTRLARSDNSWTVTLQRFKPEAISVSEVGYIIPGSTADHLYFTTLGPTNYRMGTGGTDALTTYQSTSILTDDGWVDVTPENPPLSPTRLAEDPDDPSTYYIGTGRNGLYIIRDGEIVGRYNASNAPMDNSWGARVYEASFDYAGNLWVEALGTSTDRSIMILTPENRAKDPENLSATDWIVPETDSYVFSKDCRIFHCADRRTTLIFNASTDHLLLAYDNNNTPTDFTDDRWRIWDSFTDQDGVSFQPSRLTAIAEDSDGKIFIGTSSGIIQITDPSAALEQSLTVRRLKIDHNDGTGLADYLAETDRTLDISIDGAGRKWIATEQSGIYVVSADGTEIVDQFTSTNSPLPSDRIDAIYCSPTSRSVYIATGGGLMEYGNKVSPSADEMAQLKVYPNPYRPALHGSLTIEGLTDGALVKITTASGATIAQKRAEGGTVIWDGRTTAGNEASSGVYYILASPPSGATGKSATGKFVIVR